MEHFFGYKKNRKSFFTFFHVINSISSCTTKHKKFFFLLDDIKEFYCILNLFNMVGWGGCMNTIKKSREGNKKKTFCFRLFFFLLFFLRFIDETSTFSKVLSFRDVTYRHARTRQCGHKLPRMWWRSSSSWEMGNKGGRIFTCFFLSKWNSNSIPEYYSGSTHKKQKEKHEETFITFWVGWMCIIVKHLSCCLFLT